MPEVFLHDDIEQVFERARTSAEEPTQDADGIYRRQMIIITPGRLLIGKECPLASELLAENREILEKYIPIKPIRRIGVITYTLLEALKKDIRRTIPFVDYLLGFAALGHSVWAFEGHASALTAGCRDADLLLVDSGMLPELDKNPEWRQIAFSKMKGKEIKLISRENFI